MNNKKIPWDVVALIIFITAFFVYPIFSLAPPPPPPSTEEALFIFLAKIFLLMVVALFTVLLLKVCMEYAVSVSRKNPDKFPKLSVYIEKHYSVNDAFLLVSAKWWIILSFLLSMTAVAIYVVFLKDLNTGNPALDSEHDIWGPILSLLSSIAIWYYFIQEMKRKGIKLWPWSTETKRIIFGIAIATVLIFLTTILFAVFTKDTRDEMQPPTDSSATNTSENRVIAVFVEADPGSSENLEQIKVATIIVLPDGSLELHALQKYTWAFFRLENALKDIAARPELKLTGETEEVIDGRKALVMTEYSVSKTDRDYLYGVVNALNSEFGFYAEIEYAEVE